MNQIICKNCSASNPFYELICRKCKAYIRERVVNIDLWKTISLLIESPSKAYTAIIHAEHKNFISLIIFLASMKLLIDVMLLSSFTAGSDNPFVNFFIHLLIIIVFLILLITAFSWLYKSILKRQNTETRFKDNVAVLIYSMFPHILGITILFPVEMVVFGGFLFSNNPSPFILKETVAFIFLGFEILLILWQIFLTTVSFLVQSRSLIIAIIFSIIFNFILYFILYLYSFLFF